MAKKAGRPTDYKPEYDEQAYRLCLLGSTDAQLGDAFGVVENTINNWKRDHPSFLGSIKNGKVTADANVAEALYKRATGYVTIQEFAVFGDDDVRVVVREETKSHPPDTAAAFIWLKNRSGWRDKQEVEHSGGVNMIYDPVLDGPLPDDTE